MTLNSGHELETERLRLRPVDRGDADALRRLFDRPEVRRYLFDDQRVDAATTEEIVAASLARFREHGYGLWLAIPRIATPRGSSPDGAAREEEAPIAGFVGFAFFYDPPELQIFLGLAPEFWGQGLALEMGRRVIDHSFDVLGFEEVIGATDAPNSASAKLMRRLGMERLPDQERHGVKTLYFRIRRNSPVQ